MLPSWSDVNASGRPGERTEASAAARRVRGWCASWWGGVALVLLCAGLYLPGLWSIAPVDRDECRFAQSARQMLEAGTLPRGELDEARDEGRPTGLHAGGWAVPMYGHQPRLNKPPLTAWVQAASAWVLTGGDARRDGMWMYRVPSVLAAVASVLLTWRLGRAMTDARVAWLGAALLAAAPMVVWDAHQARADQLMMATVVAAHLCMWMVYRARGERLWVAPVGFWCAVAVSIMVKGPIGPMVVALTAGAVSVVSGRWRWLAGLRPVVGVVVIAAVVAPWLWAIERQFGLGWYARLVWEEVVVRAATGSREGHFAPPGTHLVLLAVLFWPGCLLALAGVMRGVARGLPRRVGDGDEVGGVGVWARVRGVLRRRAGREGEMFLLAWVVPSWVVFELSLAKLPHYTMPLYPAVALLSARMVFAATGRLTAGAVGTWVWLAVGAVPTAALVVAAGVVLWNGGVGGGMGLWMSIALMGVAAFVGAMALTAALQAVRARAWVMAQLGGLVAGVVVLAAAMQFVVPEFAPGARTAVIMQDVGRLDLDVRRPIASTYHEDSMVFATRGRVERLGAGQIAGWAEGHPGGVAVLSRRPVDAEAVAAVVARGWRSLTEDARAVWVVYVGPGRPGEGGR